MRYSELIHSGLKCRNESGECDEEKNGKNRKSNQKAKKELQTLEAFSVRCSACLSREKHFYLLISRMNIRNFHSLIPSWFHFLYLHQSVVS